MPVLGLPATPQTFEDSEAYVSRIIHALAPGHTCIVTGPRRSGKSSILMAVAHQLQGREPLLFVSAADRDPLSVLGAFALEERVASSASHVTRFSENPTERLNLLWRRLTSDGPFTLIIDDIDRGPTHPATRTAWSDFLRLASTSPGVRLLVSIDPSSLETWQWSDEWSWLFERAEIFRIRPWSSAAIHSYVSRYLNISNTPMSPDLADRLAHELAPAWPHEIIQALYRLEDGEDRSFDAALDAVAESHSRNRSVIDALVAQLNKRNARPAALLLSTMAHARGPVSLEEIAAATSPPVSRSELYDAAKDLESEGVITFDGPDLVNPATALTARKLRIDARRLDGPR